MSAEPARPPRIRHVHLILGLMALAIVVFVGTRLDSFKAKVSDMAAVTDGRAAAERLTSPDSLLAYVLRHPEQASLVVFDTDAPEDGLAIEAEAVRPMAGVPALALALAYAESVEAGGLDPDEAVPYADIEVFTLPAIEGDRHLATLARMGLADTLMAQEGGAPPEEVVSVRTQIPLRRVVEAALTYSDRPATDYLTLRFGPRTLRDALGNAGVDDPAAPVPMSGLYLAWTPEHRGTDAQSRLDGFLALPPAQQADTAFAVATRLRDDDAYRARERERLRFQSLGMTVDQQRAATASFPTGTAQAYADLLAGIATQAETGDAVATRVDTILGNPLDLFAPLVGDAVVRGKAGGFTGVLSMAAYARQPDGAVRVAVLLLQDLPTAVFIEVGRQALDQGLLAGLLGSDAFFERAKAVAATP
ncbi:MAG: serine hydrolase [Bacteroidota bacterium]